MREEIYFQSFVRRVKKSTHDHRYGISLSNYRGTLSRCFAGTECGMTVGSISGHRYRSGIALLRRVRSRGRTNHGKAVPVPETGSEGISRGARVCTWLHTYSARAHVCVRVCMCARCACMLVHARADTVGRCRRERRILRATRGALDIISARRDRNC